MSISFTGNSYFQSDASKLPTANGAKAVCFWLQATDVNSTPQSVFNATNSTLGTGYQIGLRNGALSVWGFGGTVVVSFALTTEWTHVAYTFDGTTHRLFFNGVQVASTTSAPQAGQPLLCQIGSNQWSEYLRNSQVEDIRVYGRALSSNELLTIANSSSRDSIVHQLIAHWPCTQGVESALVSASDFIDYYGVTSTLVGTTPYPVARGSRMLQRRA